MLRTIIWFIYFWYYLIASIPTLSRAKKLDKLGKTAERDAIVNAKTKKWAQSLLKLAGATVIVHGSENLPKNQSFVLVSNHQGNFDIPVLLGNIDVPLFFIAKIEILKIPLIRSWMKLMQCVFMDRKSVRQSLDTIHKAADLVRNGYNAIIFPEGTRSKGRPVGDFKQGSFKLATEANALILPVSIDGTYRLMESNKNRITPGTVTLTIHPPVPTEGLERDAISLLPQVVRTKILSGIVIEK